jgi:hypothetical protein
MAGMENKSNESSESKGKMASKAQRFESLDGLEEYEKDDIHSLLNKLLAATDVVEVKKAKNWLITRFEQSDIDDNLQKLLNVVPWNRRPRPSPPVLANQIPPSLGPGARRLLRKIYARIQDGLEDDEVMSASTYADGLLGMVKEFSNELGVGVVQPDEVWEPSDTKSNDGQGNYHPSFHHFGFLVADSICRLTTTTTTGMHLL